MAPTRDGQVEALLNVLGGDDLTAATEAADALATLGPEVVPRLVSEMRRARNNWLLGGVLAKIGPPAVGPLIEVLRDADEATAIDCMYLLGGLQDLRAVPHLARHLDDRRERVRMYAVTALLDIGGDRAVEAVLERLAREGRGLGGFMVEALLRYGRSGVDPLLRNAASADPRVRREVAYLLGRLGDPRAAENLVRLLSDSEPLVRRNAAYALGLLGKSIQEPGDAIAALADLLADGDDDISEAARQALVGFGGSAFAALAEKCRTGEQREILAAVNGLREIGDPRAQAVMIELLRHRQRLVRVAAVAALIVVGSEEAVEPLLNALRDEDLRWFASIALERFGSSRPELFLAAQPSDPNLGLRTEMLVRLGRPVVPALIQYLRDDAPARRVVALWVLGEIGDGSAATAVAGLLDDPALGSTAGRTLRKLGDAGLAELIRYAPQPRTEYGGVQAVDALALFEDERALRALEACLCAPVPRKARVRAAVRIAMLGEPQTSERLRAYLEADGRELWSDVQQALREEGQIR